MIKRILPLILTTSLLWISACASARSLAPEAGAPPFEELAAREMAEPASAVFMDDAQGEIMPAVGQTQTERLVIKNADLTIVVDDPVKSMDNITYLAEEMGGFVVSANLREMTLDSGAKSPRASITIRVPAADFNDALARIKEETEQLPLNENISSQDVTSEYTDLQSRLRNLEATEDQLTEIMGSANKTEDVLSVYNRLVQVREQIEVIKGQIQYYEQSAAMSLISVELIANEAVQPLTIGGWQPVGTAKDAVQTLINTLKVLGNLVIWIILYVLPVLVVLFVIFVLPLRLVWQAWRRRKAKGKESLPPAPPSQST